MWHFNWLEVQFFQWREFTIQYTMELGCGWVLGVGCVLIGFLWLSLVMLGGGVLGRHEVG